MNEIYNKIKAIRVSKGLTQNEVAEKIGMAQSNYGQLEKGLIQVTIERLEQLSDIFDMFVGNILNYEGNVTIEKADVDFLRDEVIRLQKLVTKYKKENEELREESDEEFGGKLKERVKSKNEIKSLKEKLAIQKERLEEKDRTIKLLEKTIEALTKSTNGKG